MANTQQKGRKQDFMLQSRVYIILCPPFGGPLHQRGCRNYQSHSHTGLLTPSIRAYNFIPWCVPCQVSLPSKQATYSLAESQGQRLNVVAGTGLKARPSDGPRGPPPSHSQTRTIEVGEYQWEYTCNSRLWPPASVQTTRMSILSSLLTHPLSTNIT